MENSRRKIITQAVLKYALFLLLLCIVLLFFTDHASAQFVILVLSLGLNLLLVCVVLLYLWYNRTDRKS